MHQGGEGPSPRPGSRSRKPRSPATGGRVRPRHGKSPSTRRIGVVPVGDSPRSILQIRRSVGSQDATRPSINVDQSPGRLEHILKNIWMARRNQGPCPLRAAVRAPVPDLFPGLPGRPKAGATTPSGGPHRGRTDGRLDRRTRRRCCPPPPPGRRGRLHRVRQPGGRLHEGQPRSGQDEAVAACHPAIPEANTALRAGRPACTPDLRRAPHTTPDRCCPAHLQKVCVEGRKS